MLDRCPARRGDRFAPHAEVVNFVGKRAPSDFTDASRVVLSRNDAEEETANERESTRIKPLAGASTESEHLAIQ